MFVALGVGCWALAGATTAFVISWREKQRPRGWIVDCRVDETVPQASWLCSWCTNSFLHSALIHSLASAFTDSYPPSRSSLDSAFNKSHQPAAGKKPPSSSSCRFVGVVVSSRRRARSSCQKFVVRASRHVVEPRTRCAAYLFCLYISSSSSSSCVLLVSSSSSLWSARMFTCIIVCQASPPGCLAD
jgi:hypothetical protein